LKHPLLIALAVAALGCAAVPVTAQTTAPVPGPTNLAAPPPAPATAVPANAQGTPPASIPTPAITPPPLVTPPPLPPSASPSPSPSSGKRGRSKASPGPTPSAPVETPSPPAFASLDGDWEFVQSTRDDDTYSRLILRQTGQSLSGTWKLGKSKSQTYPVEGQYDGKSIKLTSVVNGKTWTMTGYVDNASDMVGLVYTPDGKRITFTANHRAAAKQELLIKP
jgi:hypothetical protein